MGLWDDDPAFKSLAGNKSVKLNRLSWQCSNLMCDQCDGFIHYNFKKVKSEWINSKTGQKEQEIEDFEWNTAFESVQLEGGTTQDKQNTPEGSKCECHHCHGRPGYDKWKKEQERVIGTYVGPVNPYKQNELSNEERKNLK